MVLIYFFSDLLRNSDRLIKSTFPAGLIDKKSSTIEIQINLSHLFQQWGMQKENIRHLHTFNKVFLMALIHGSGFDTEPQEKHKQHYLKNSKKLPTHQAL